MSGDSLLAATRGLCNECGRLVDAKLVAATGESEIVKWCQAHGESRGLVCSDLAWYQASQSYVKPGTSPLRRAVGEHHGCPGSCGLCPEHQQHTCVPLVEVTAACDLQCPICLVEGCVGQPAMTLAQAAAVAEGLVAGEGQINMLTLSGGEPTRHPDLLGLIDALARPELGVPVAVHQRGCAWPRTTRSWPGWSSAGW